MSRQVLLLPPLAAEGDRAVHCPVSHAEPSALRAVAGFLEGWLESGPEAPVDADTSVLLAQGVDT